MCNGMNVLQHGRHGYVAACCGCGRFQIAFGTTLMHLEVEAVRDLTEETGRDLQVFKHRICAKEKAFIYDTGAPCMRIILDHEEVGALHTMLSEALWIHGIYASMTEGEA